MTSFIPTENLFYLLVKKGFKDFHYPHYFHSGIGYIIDQDKEHIYFRFIRILVETGIFVSSIHKFDIEDIRLQSIEIV